MSVLILCRPHVATRLVTKDEHLLLVEILVTNINWFANTSAISSANSSTDMNIRSRTERKARLRKRAFSRCL